MKTKQAEQASTSGYREEPLTTDFGEGDDSLEQFLTPPSPTYSQVVAGKQGKSPASPSFSQQMPEQGHVTLTSGLDLYRTLYGVKGNSCSG